MSTISNSTDFLARSLEIRYGFYQPGEREKKYVHTVTSSLLIPNKVISAIIENHQAQDVSGIAVLS